MVLHGEKLLTVNLILILIRFNAKSDTFHDEF